MKTLYPPGYHHVGFVVIHALGHMMYGYTLLVPMNQRVHECMSCHKAILVIIGRAHCFHDNIYIMLILLLRDLSTLCVVDHL